MVKSAYERALERFGGDSVQELTDEQKARIAEIDRRGMASKAEAEVMAADRLRKAADNPEKCAQIREDLVTELASIRQRVEREKEAVRNAR